MSEAERGGEMGGEKDGESRRESKRKAGVNRETKRDKQIRANGHFAHGIFSGLRHTFLAIPTKTISFQTFLPRIIYSQTFPQGAVFLGIPLLYNKTFPDSPSQDNIFPDIPRGRYAKDISPRTVNSRTFRPRTILSQIFHPSFQNIPS